MILEIIIIISSIAVVLWGADRLTDGATAVARRFNMPEMLIGLTIVAFGTSMPELCVSMVSAFNGVADMAVGNVVGSNIFNMFLIIGVCSMIMPMAVPMQTIRRELPFAFLATLLLIGMLYDGQLSRIESAIMLVLFTAFMIYSLKKNGKEKIEAVDEVPQPSKRFPILHSPWLTIPLGLFLLVEGSDIFVDHAVTLAKQLGVSEAVIGLTILGGGTSMPELATSVVAACKGHTSMAMGNVIGSCVFNILLILGLTGVVMPLSPEGISLIDLGMMGVGSILMWVFSYTNKTMERWEGAVLTLAFIAYMTVLLMNS